ncbi:SCO3933 family regulatory protein [Microtetraspora malaysiensis]|uniref:Regulatory protein n=1 Tax=Microtetraspora malaysiensis TaxID=161358 RepID=A0ABW6SQQ2_9ACTN
MRAIPIPVDTAKLTFTCVKDPRPRLLNQHTGEVKTDKNGQTVYEVVTSVEDDFGRIELVKIGISGEPPITRGRQINPVGLIGYPWEQTRDGEVKWGIAYRASALLPAEEGANA